MHKIILVLLPIFFSLSLVAQNYTSYFTGNSMDNLATPQGGVCLMGGSTEDDNAMKWFLNQSGGGDILVLRASGSDGYNDYFFTDLGVTVNSVETIVFNDATAADELYIHQKIQQAEAIWFAGGDQWDYVSFWRNNTIENLINEAVLDKHVVIGGTSAGMAILGHLYFSAENGTVTSEEALANPYRNDVSIDSIGFIQTPFLENTITDTHYDDPDRKGRHMVFLARILEDWGIEAKGIACEEYVAVCIPPSGIARVFGEYPEYEDFAYFLQVNCQLENPLPENCSANNALDWNKAGEALKVYKLPGNTTGSNTFDIQNWLEGNGGTWYNWSVDNGVLNETEAATPTCTASSILSLEEAGISIFPNPNPSGFFEIHSESYVLEHIVIHDASGRIIFEKDLETYSFQYYNKLEKGVYFLDLQTEEGNLLERILVW